MVAEGTRFVNAINPAPLCAPSRACLASGREYDYTYVPSNNKDYSLNYTVYSLLEEAGYLTMTAGKDDLTKKHGVGLDGSYHASKLGFMNYRRCDGKHQSVKYYPNVTDPYKTLVIFCHFLTYSLC